MNKYKHSFFLRTWRIERADTGEVICEGPKVYSQSDGNLLWDAIDLAEKAQSDEEVREIMKPWKE
jgi:hypothetical protein